MTYQLHPIISTQSRAKIFRIIPIKSFLRGRKFEIFVSFLNKGERFAGGEFELLVYYSTRQANRLHGPLSPLASGELSKTMSHVFNALADGYGLIHCSVKSDKEVILTDESEKPLAKEDALASIYVLAERDLYTFYALVLSAISLAIIAFERLIGFFRVLLNLLCYP